MNTGVFWKRKSDGAIVCAVLNTQSGFFARYTNGKTRLSAYDNPLAIAFNTPTWAEITESHANVLQAQCAEIRGKKG